MKDLDRASDTTTKEIESLFIDYRIRCDMALSERDDGVYTQEEYEKAIQWQLNHATAQLEQLIQSKVVEELESITGFSNIGGVYTKAGVDTSQKAWQPIPINDRIKQLKDSRRDDEL